MESKGKGQSISLHVKGGDLNNSDGSFTCYAKVFLNENKGEFKLIGQTETVKKDPHPKFGSFFYANFFLNRIQNVRIEIWELHTVGKDTLYGTVNTTLVDIMTNQTNDFQLRVLPTDAGIKKSGTVSLMAGNVGTNCVKWTWSGRKLKNMDTFSKSDPFLQYHFVKDDGDKIFLGKSETVMDCNDPQWKPSEFSLSLLCRSDLNRKFLIRCRDWEASENYKDIGEVRLCINDVLGKDDFEVEIKDKENKVTGYLRCQNCSVTKPEFVDYLMGGQQINVIANIDFTASNGEYTSEHSLHCQDLKKNQYLTTLKAVSNILLAFDFDKQIELYGFGGVPEYPNFKRYDTEHCFPLTGDEKNHQVCGLQGIIDAYQNSLQNVVLCGPTLFGPSLEKGLQIAQKNAAHSIYTIQLILTDGVIDDIAESQRLLAQGGQYPYSVIIVGIGNDKFDSMKQLDGPDVKNQAQGVSIRRDICQFVKYVDYKNDPEALLDAILGEIPSQLTSYKLVKKEYVITSKPAHIPPEAYKQVRVVANQAGGYQGNAYSHCTQSSNVCGASYSSSSSTSYTSSTKVTYN